jgi:hypothetical protein
MTTLRAFFGAGFAAMPRVELSEAAAPAATAAEKVRLFIITIVVPSAVDFFVQIITTRPWAGERSALFLVCGSVMFNA